MTQTPTNTDLAAALREIADTLPIGPQLIVRLAADRLGEPGAAGDGWIEWSNDDGKPDLPNDTMIEWHDKFGDVHVSPVGDLGWGVKLESMLTRYRRVIAFMR